MKLKDLLVQELPKRGGWPECSVAHLYKFLDKEKLTFIVDREFSFFEDWEGNQVTREQYEAALAAAQQPVWNGEGLPPVGCECEHCSYSGVVTVVQIIAHFKNRAAMVAVYIPVEGDMKQVQQSVADCFRPLRTEVEKARELGIKLMLNCVTNYNKTDVINAIEELYDAGYRKG